MASPKQGDTFTYTAKFTLTNMTETNVTNQVVLTVNADPNTPWQAVPPAASFSSPYGTPTLTNCTTTTCTATYANVKSDGVVTFSAPAKVSASLGSGALVVGTASAKVTSTPGPLTLTGTSSFLGDNGLPNDCSGTYTFTWVVQPGAWLMDVHFADGLGEGKVTPDPLSTLVPWTLGTTSKNYLRVQDSGGADLTPTKFAAASGRGVVIAPDATKPYFPGDTIQTNYPNARWLDSLNWKYDPGTYTGDTWLPAGSTVTISRHVTYANCAPGGFTTDNATARPFGASLEVARPVTTAQTTAQDSWAMPGLQPPLSCTNLLISDNTTTDASGPTVISTWTPPSGPKTALSSLNVGTHAIAQSSKYPTLTFFQARSGTAAPLMMYGNGTTTTLNATLSITGASTTADGLAFDADGNLWLAVTVANNATQFYYLTAAEVATLVTGGTASWHTGANTSWLLGDFAFDGNNVMWMVDRFDNTIYKVGRAGLYTGSPTRTKVGSTGIAYNSTNLLRGLAFVGETLYVGQRNATGTSLYTVNLTTGAATPVPTSSYASSAISDLASCSFPTFAASYAVQKSVINTDGSISPAGATGTQTTVNPDGTVTVTYLVTVRNTSNYNGTFPAITDTVTVPSGFTITDVKLDGVSQGPTGSFTIAGASLAATQITSYVVTLTARATSLGAVNWTTAGTCNTTNAGTPSDGGFFNLVTMADDSDGAANNDACVPAVSPQTARLALIKRIVDSQGNELPNYSTDARFFTLLAGAAGTSGTPVSTVSGASPTSGATAVDQLVVPGTYLLSEQGNDGGTTSGTYTPGTWSCINRPSGTPFTVTDRKISVAAGSNVACTITNTRNPLVHVVKDAATPDPALGNSHVGTRIIANTDGTFTANYTVIVTNDSSFIGNTGPVFDTFVPPAGLVWDSSKTASIGYLPGSTGATLTPLPPTPWTVTQAQLRDGAVLANSIQNIPGGASVRFTISIPLAIDLTVASGQTQSNYDLNATNLGQCTNVPSPGGFKYTDTLRGVPNTVALSGENLNYGNDIPTKDNVACVPVLASTTWKIQKAAPLTYNADGTVATWAPAGATGSTVQVAADGTVTARYQVVITNSGTYSGSHPAFTDAASVPAGFTVTDVLLSTTSSVPGTSQGATGAFTIPAGADWIAPSGTATYYVTVKGKAASLSGVDWARAGTCNTTGAGAPSAGGFFNVVSMSGDTDGSDNNDACVPVGPPTAVINVQKFASNCDVAQPTCKLDGASFALYAVDPTTSTGAQPISNGIAATPAGGSLFTSAPLSFPATYWLVETKAPAGYQPLATPIRFSLGASGISVTGGGSSGITVTGSGNLTLNVVDPTIGPLPKAGGSGPAPYAVLGLLLILAGAAHHHRNFRFRGRHAAC